MHDGVIRDMERDRLRRAKMADDIKKACDICELSTKRSDPEQKLSITD
jgi:hypothetical protein